MRVQAMKSFVLKSLMIVFVILVLSSVLHHGSTKLNGVSDYKTSSQRDGLLEKHHLVRSKTGRANSKSHSTDRVEGVKSSNFIQSATKNGGAYSKSHSTEKVEGVLSDEQTKFIMPNSRPKIDPEVKVIVLSYMRSGSTLTGDVYNHHSQVFYVYEPLLTLAIRYADKKRNVTFFNRDPIEYDPEKVPGLMLELVNQSINCEFESMYQAVLMSKVMRRNSMGTQAYHECVGEKGSLDIVQKCLPLLPKHCALARAVVTKVVRFSMELAARLLQEDPKVKVVHLLRDPRGVMQSMVTSGLEDRYLLTSKDFCDKVTKDLKDSIPLKRQFPGRVMTIRYEDLAQNPLDFTARLMHFAGLEMEPALKEYVWNITSSQSDDLKMTKFNTVRSDSSAAASAWRDSISPKMAVDTMKDCQELSRLMGYLPLDNSAQLKDQTTPYYDQNFAKAPMGLWMEK